MVADIMRSHYDADMALINSGNIRNNVQQEPGPLKLKFISQNHPFVNDKVILVRLNGNL